MLSPDHPCPYGLPLVPLECLSLAFNWERGETYTWTNVDDTSTADVAENMTGPYEELPNAAVMAYQQGWTTPAYFLTFYPTEEHGMLLNHQVVAPGK